MTYREKYKQWITDDFFGEEMHQKLMKLSDEKEIEDCFYKEISFGTGGLRGIMGAGTNRMNKFTVGKVTTGLGIYLIGVFGEEVCRTRGVVIGYDTRNQSLDLAKITADILTGMGIRVFLHTAARPTPQLSFSIKFLNAIAGVVITASHNPKEYNGYKVYDEHGCQLVPAQAEQVICYIKEIKDYHDINFLGNQELLAEVDVTNEFVFEVQKQSRYQDKEAKQNLKIVYTPLHGTGRVPVQKILSLAGFSQVNLVEVQADEDGNFSTVVSPNPEDVRALELGMIQAEKSQADIVLGTDPDCDRVGIAVRNQDGSYQLLTGNQTGALLMSFLLKHTDLQEKKAAVIKTVVTSELGAKIAEKHGVSVFSTLTGFKFIGEKITQFEQAKQNGIKEKDYDFLFGYEESYGYLAGTHARDKDAVVSALLICEMAAEAKAEGNTLTDKLEQIYQEYGYYLDALDSMTFPGKDGVEKMNAFMRELRTSKVFPFENTTKVLDYQTGILAEEGFGNLPVADVLKYVLKGGSWVAIRPSGTEPKLKIYYSICEKNKQEAERYLENIRQSIQQKLK